MRNSKSILESKTIWGIAVAAIPVLNSIYSQLSTIPAEVLPPHIASIVSGLGLFVAFIGRLTANKSISGVLTTLDK